MGAAPSTPQGDADPKERAEYSLWIFVGPNPQRLRSEFWKKLLSVPIDAHWQDSRVLEACQALAQNNGHTRHLAKLLIHLVWSLQELTSGGLGSTTLCSRAMTAACLSSTFLKYLIETLKGDSFKDALFLSLTEEDVEVDAFPEVNNIPEYVLQGLLSFVGTTEVTQSTYFLHLEVVNLLLVAMSTQLHSGPAAGPEDIHPFLDAAMRQENSLVGPFVRRLLLSYITQIPASASPGYSLGNTRGDQAGVLRKVGSAAVSVVLLPYYYTYNYFLNSHGETSKRALADNSLLLLLVLIHYRKYMAIGSTQQASHEYVDKNNSTFGERCIEQNPYAKALEAARDIELDRVDLEGNIGGASTVRLPFASLFDVLGVYLTDETSILLLYTLLHGNSDFLEYVLVRTDIDTLIMPILEMLYNAAHRSSNQIYMLLIILLILSQDSSFNASIHKLIIPNVPWYKERLLHRTSLGSLMVVILIRTVKYNLSKLRDIYLHTNCLAILANMAPHVHRLSAYASQRLVSLFDMLSRKYKKVAQIYSGQAATMKHNSMNDKEMAEDTPNELHIYTDFLRIVLEIINAIFTYALPRNPEVVYALLHRQELFKPFKGHPRFFELVENIYTVLDFFNSRMDSQYTDDEWSVEKVLQIIVSNCRSWRGEGMKMFTQLRFTYEQELHPEEFFIPYVWRLVLSICGLKFNLENISLFQGRPQEEDVLQDCSSTLLLSSSSGM
eukprot:TRINITY_DN5186_c0_g2_i1.p1 TRINITY_DN5186_c0_g2~~TRINITY_DN5186_c0_g2_i1.p1  ORF type:complete len:724 (+),score=122.40 TRINITY_DN5186_c0_g2_i1:15-2186(+)